MSSLAQDRCQPITGLIPPQQREVTIRVAWPSVAAVPPVATFGRLCIRSWLLAPLGWLAMLPLYFMKVLPILGKRYALTSKRLIIQRGWRRVSAAEIPLGEIEDIRIVRDSNSLFFRSGTIEILAKGQVRLTLPGIKEPEVFYHAIRNTCLAWVPDRAKDWLKFIPAKPA